ncbi:MAG: chromosomal replication initiator protein DnaA [Dehalococcoidia bacterium]|nr:chromosomal replication initiator protein DnaA [Dehalococcoidia bacterium]
MNGDRAISLWQAALSELKGQVSKANFETWLRDTVALSYEDGCLTVGAPSGLAVEWLQERMASVVHTTLARVVGHSLEVSFVLSEECPPKPSHRSGPARQDSVDAVAAGARLNPRYTFDKFVVGGHNRLAHAASQAAAEKPGESYNPLFIYGGTGLGKTHLLHAVGHSFLQHKLKMLYVSCEQFTNEFVNAIRENRNEEFRRKFRGVDVLLIDDIQFIAGKEGTQEEFFHTFNDLHSSGRQLVISSDRHPKSMPVLEDRLRSRFQWGLIADIQPPDFETRVAILRSKADLLGVSIPSEVLDHVAQKVHNNIRELEGCLNRLAAHSRLHRSPLTVESVVPILKDYLQSSGRRSLPPQTILEAICKYYNLETKQLAGKKRDKVVSLPRQIAMYLLREETEASLNDIGRALGGRDHSTVLHGWHKISNEITGDLSLRKEVMELKDILYSRRFS